MNYQYWKTYFKIKNVPHERSNHSISYYTEYWRGPKNYIHCGHQLKNPEYITSKLFYVSVNNNLFSQMLELSKSESWLEKNYISKELINE